MKLPGVLKRKIEEGGATKRKNAKMGQTRVDMWGNDLWSISIMGKKNKTVSERKKSDKLVFVFLR